MTKTMWLVTFSYESEIACAATFLADSAEGARQRAAELYTQGWPPESIEPVRRAILEEAVVMPVEDGMLVRTRAPY